MKHLFAALLAPFLCPTKAQNSDDIDIPRLTRAIAMVENWDGHSVGKSGERGRLQFKEATWKQFSRHPHKWADCILDLHLRHTRTVERLYLSWLINKALPSLSLKPTVYNCAIVHNAGYGNVTHGVITAPQADFANRVANCYYDNQKKDGK